MVLSFDSRPYWLVFSQRKPFPAVSILTCDRAHGLSPYLDNLTSMTLLPHGDRGTGSFRRDISIGSNNRSTCLHWGLYETHRDWWIVSQNGCALTSGSLALTQKLPSVSVSGGLVAGWPIVYRSVFVFEVYVGTKFASQQGWGSIGKCTEIHRCSKESSCGSWRRWRRLVPKVCFTFEQKKLPSKAWNLVVETIRF